MSSTAETTAGPVGGADPEETATFADLGLRPELLAALTRLGYEEPTPIQREAIPPMAAGRDLLGQAATGTGKTAAYALPVLQRLPDERPGGDPLALVLVPTRELAIQVSEALRLYRGTGWQEIPCYGYWRDDPTTICLEKALAPRGVR